MQENEHLRDEFQKKVLSMEELKTFQSQAQEFLQSENYMAYL